MAKYRSLPVEIDAVRYTHYDYHKLLGFVREFHSEAKFTGSALRINPEVGSFHHDAVDESFTIPTPEGDMKLRPGEYLIRGTMGEFYPCKAEVFEKKYVEID